MAFLLAISAIAIFIIRPVSEVVWQRLPATLGIALVCHFLASLFGISLGILAATKQYSWVDTVLSVFTFLGMTIPRFLMALIILYFMAFHFNVQELGSFYSTKFGGQPMSWAKFWDLIKHIWPVDLDRNHRRSCL